MTCGMTRLVEFAMPIDHICSKFEGPYRVLSLWWSNHFGRRRGWSQRPQFLRHALDGHLEHGRAT